MSAIASAATVAVETSAKTHWWTDFLTGLGIATIAYIGQWSHLLTLSPADLFWLESPPTPLRYICAILSNILLGILAFAVIRATRNRNVYLATAGHVMVVLLAALCCNSVRDLIAGYYPDAFGGNLLRSLSVAEIWGVLAVCGVLFAVGVRYMRKGILDCIRSSLIAVSLFGLWNMGRAAYEAVVPLPFSAVTSRAAFLPAAAGAGPKVIWLVFDEFDYRLAFENRIPGLALPHLNDFQETALSASHAYPPSSATSNSMLTYLLGEKVEKLRSTSAEELIIRTAEHPEVRSWKALPNLFSEARKAGVNGAVVGWYLPYPKIVGADVVDCWWFDKITRDTIGDSLPEILLSQPRALVETSLLSPFGQSALTQRRSRLFDQFMAKARELIRDPRVGLLLLHAPVPHTPYFYDHRTGRKTLANSSIEGYWDALALVDKAVGEIQTEMKASGTWDRSAILIGSDHFYRTAMRLDGHMDRRVPFLLKMPAQRRPLVFDKPFNTQLLHDMVLNIVRGSLQNDEQAKNWLEKASATVPVGWGVH